MSEHDEFEGVSTLGLLFGAIQERLDRIEKRLGIEGLTPSQAELERRDSEETA